MGAAAVEVAARPSKLLLPVQKLIMLQNTAVVRAAGAFCRVDVQTGAGTAATGLNTDHRLFPSS